MTKISPSILSCDFSNLQQQCNELIGNGADMLHIDVMDGHFVPNITIGAPVLKSISEKVPNTFYDVHLMIDSPLTYAKDFILAGADIVTFHIEVKENIEKIIKSIKSYGVKVGIAVKPSTNIEEVYPYLMDIDMVLIMTVEPGFGGQSFMDMTKKIKTLSEKIKDMGIKNFYIQVDGGINDKTAVKCKENGANVLVAGSYIFKSDNVKKAIDSLR